MKENLNFLSTGKLPHNILSTLIEHYTTKNPDVVVGSKIGEDAAVIEFGNKYLLAKTDPITFVTDEIGYYAININANDIACMGGVPRWFLASLLLPEGLTTEKMVENIFSLVSAACKEKNIAFCGGHTEITYGIDRPILVGQMLGEVDKEKLIINSNAQIDDDILLTKGIAIEATSIIAREKGTELVETFSQQLVDQCKNYIYDPGIGVLKEAQIAAQLDEIHAMHDPTEGGLAVAAAEFKKFGEAYAKQVIRNAKELGQALYERGIQVVCPDKGFTESHTLLVDICNFQETIGLGGDVEQLLEKAHIVANRNLLPWDIIEKRHYTNPGGIRIGTQEITHLGMKESEMIQIAEFFKSVLVDKKNPDEVAKDVTDFREEFQTIHYAFESALKAYEYIKIV